MLGDNLVVNSYVIIRKGCPLAVTPEGPDHILVSCGRRSSQGFEIVFEAEAFRALVEISAGALTEMDASTTHGSTAS